MIPILTTNGELIANRTKDSVLKEFLNEEYDIVIAYTEKSYWWKDLIIYEALGKKSGVWYVLKIESKIKKNKKYRKPKIRSNSIQSFIGEKLMNQLNSIGFWELSNDSLNIQKKYYSDSSAIVYSVSDGATYQLELIENGQLTIIKAYEPKYYLEKIPEIKSREIFLEGIKLFRSTLNKIGT